MGFLDSSVVPFRVLPNDLDFNGHMNNGRYLTLMDLGRIDLIVRGGLWKHVLKNGWKPVVSFTQFRFKKSLLPWQSYQLVTRFICWDSKVFYIEQNFVRNGEVVGYGVVKGLFVVRGKSVPTTDVVAASGLHAESPVMPQWLSLLVESEKVFWEQVAVTR